MASGFRVKGETGLLSNQGEKSINLYFIRVLLRKKVLKYGTPKPSILWPQGLGLRVKGAVKRFTSQGLRVEWSQEVPLNHQTLLQGSWDLVSKLISRL